MEGVLSKGVLSGNGVCLEAAVMYGGGFVRWGFVRGGFVRRGFCPRTTLLPGRLCSIEHRFYFAGSHPATLQLKHEDDSYTNIHHCV